jgi:hypothetical protein
MPSAFYHNISGLDEIAGGGIPPSTPRYQSATPPAFDRFFLQNAMRSALWEEQRDALSADLASIGLRCDFKGGKILKRSMLNRAR